MKSITPIISVILLVLLTIVASVSAFFFINSSVLDLESQGSADTFPGSDNSRLNLVSITGSKAIVRNDGTSPVTEIVMFVNGELLNYTLDSPIQPGQLKEIEFTTQQAGEDLEIKIIYNSGKIEQETSPAEKNTLNSGFMMLFDLFQENCTMQNYIWITGNITGINGSCCGNNGIYDNFYSGLMGNTTEFCLNGTYSPYSMDLNKTLCDYYYPNSWMTGTITGNNGSCCGDDGLLDNFSNATHICNNGVLGSITNDTSQSVCQSSGYLWFSGTVTGDNGACCGDDELSDTFYNGSIGDTEYFCQNSTFINQDVDSNNTLCTFYGFTPFKYFLTNALSFSNMITLGTIPWGSPVVKIADLNNDGNNDIVLVEGTNPIFWFKGFGNGTFANRVQIGSTQNGGAKEALAIDDLNNDTNLDIVAADNSAYLHYWFGNGDGTMSSRNTFPQLASSSFQVIISDVNNDNNKDILSSQGSSGGIILYLGYGNGSFNPKIDVPFSPYGTMRFRVVDINNDNLLDIVGITTGQFAYSLMGSGDGNFSNYSVISTPSTGHALEVADINNDSYVDMLFGGINNGLYLALNYGNGSFNESVYLAPTPLNEYIIRIKVLDINNDYKKDVIFSLESGNEENPLYLLGYGNGSFQAQLPISSDTIGTADVDINDLDNDQDYDIIVVNVFDTNVHSWYNQMNTENNVCCGDDGAADVFSNSTHSCCAGNFQAGSC